MRRIVSAVIILTAVAAPALAALPPEHQRMAEFKAIVAAAEANGVPSAIGPINAIAYVGPDVYEIRSDRCVVTALIVTAQAGKAPPIVGPRQFEVQLLPPNC